MAKASALRRKALFLKAPPLGLSKDHQAPTGRWLEGGQANGSDDSPGAWASCAEEKAKKAQTGLFHWAADEGGPSRACVDLGFRS